MGPRDRDEYGVVNEGQRKHKAHRVAWTLAVGPIPDGLNVLHRCDNPPCVRSSHLFLGSQTENRADCVAKGRSRGGRVHLIGERNGLSKLTDEQRIELTRLRGVVTQDELAARYGISQSSVGRIQRGIGRQLLAAIEQAA
jgi:hypothetical protein